MVGRSRGLKNFNLERILISKIENKKTKQEEIDNGFTLVITFILLGGFIYFNPSYLIYEPLSYVITLLLLVIAIFGLGIELSKLGNQEVKVGFEDLGVGLVFGVVALSMYFYFDNLIVNYINIFLIFISIYGLTHGSIKIIKNLFLTSSKKELTLKIIIVLIQILATISAVITIADFFRNIME